MPQSIDELQVTNMKTKIDQLILRVMLLTLFIIPVDSLGAGDEFKRRPDHRGVDGKSDHKGSIRLGAYGDPSCDQETLQMLVERKWAGYTHQWRRYPHLKEWLMASIDSIDEYQEAKQLGFRTYRHTRDAEMLENEIQCPYYTHQVQCVNCLLCNGNRYRSGKDIVTWTI